MGDEAVEGFIKIRGKIYQFNSRVELENLLKQLIKLIICFIKISNFANKANFAEIKIQFNIYIMKNNKEMLQQWAELNIENVDFKEHQG